MKTKRRKFNIFEQMELECARSAEEGPVESFELTANEWDEFKRDAHNRPHTSFRKIVGRPNDPIGGDWTYRGALIVVKKFNKA
jgi:hypothetical protein